MIDNVMRKRDKEEKLTKLSNSIKGLEKSLKDEMQKIRTEIPTDADIKEKVRDITDRGENKEREYEKILKQEIEDLKEDREKAKEEIEEKAKEVQEALNEKKEEFKEKENEFEDKIEALKKNKRNNQPQSNQPQSNPDNVDTWRYKSDITEKIMGGATTITNDILNEAPIQKALNMLVRGTEPQKEN